MDNVVRARVKPLIETLIDDRVIPRIVGAGSDRFAQSVPSYSRDGQLTRYRLLESVEI